MNLIPEKFGDFKRVRSLSSMLSPTRSGFNQTTAAIEGRKFLGGKQRGDSIRRNL
jgi:hypothetical protein